MSILLLLAIGLPLGCVTGLIPDYYDVRMWHHTYQTAGPMTLHGKVVDESGNLVVGANVRAKLLLQNHAALFGRGSNWRDRWITRTSDENGRFTISGYRGASISIADVSKPGRRWYFDLDRHTSSGRNTNFYYGKTGDYAADKDNPAIFPLYREGVKEPTAEAGDIALPSRGGSNRGVPNEPQKPRRSSLDVPEQEARRWLPR